MYLGEPVSLAQETATLSWVLSYYDSITIPQEVQCYSWQRLARWQDLPTLFLTNSRFQVYLIETDMINLLQGAILCAI